MRAFNAGAERFRLAVIPPPILVASMARVGAVDMSLAALRPGNAEGVEDALLLTLNGALDLVCADVSLRLSHAAPPLLRSTARPRAARGRSSTERGERSKVFEIPGGLGYFGKRSKHPLDHLSEPRARPQRRGSLLSGASIKQPRA